MPKPRASCTACRKSKLGCDAAKAAGEACYNCVRRGQECSNAIASGRDSTRRSPKRRDTTASVHLLSDPVPDRALSLIDGPESRLDHGVRRREPSFLDTRSDGLAQRTQAQSVHRLLWDIFEQIYEPRLSLFTGSSCCPYVGSLNVR